MARKRIQKKSTFSRVVSVCMVIIAAGYYFYYNSPEFRAKVDSFTRPITAKIQKASQEHFFETISVNGELSETRKDDSAARNTETQDLSEKAPETVKTVKKASGENFFLPDFLEKPLCAGAAHGKDHELRDYSHYSICYRESYEQAEWSAYCLTEDELEKNAGRSDDFRPDTEISTGSATLADYKGSGYDRGHLSPAADFAFDKTAMSETFYMSNMSPQAGSFNRGIWKDLESQVRNWAKKFGRIYVISGPVLEKDASEYESIGANKVSIPQYYYKVLLAPLYKDEADKATPEDCHKIIAAGFILPNKKCTDSFYNYAVSIDEVEKRTGLNFFEGLEDETEELLESGIVLDEWK